MKLSARPTSFPNLFDKHWRELNIFSKRSFDWEILKSCRVRTRTCATNYANHFSNSWSASLLPSQRHWKPRQKFPVLTGNFFFTVSRPKWKKLKTLVKNGSSWFEYILFSANDSQYPSHVLCIPVNNICRTKSKHVDLH